MLYGVCTHIFDHQCSYSTVVWSDFLCTTVFVETFTAARTLNNAPP